MELHHRGKIPFFEAILKNWAPSAKSPNNVVERLLTAKSIDRKFGICAVVRMQNDRRIMSLKLYVISCASICPPIVSIILNVDKFARITTTINYAKLYYRRKVVMRLACVRFHFGLRRHGISASRNARWQQRNSIRRLTLRGRRDF